MYQYINTVTDGAGNKLTGAVIGVTDNNGGAVTLYSDFAGTTPIVSTITTDLHGQFSFFAPSGRYKITVSGSGITSYSINDVTIGDIEGLDARLDVLETDTALNKFILPSIYSGDKDATSTVEGELLAENIVKIVVKNLSTTIAAYIGIGSSLLIAKDNATNGNPWGNKFFIPPEADAVISIGTSIAYAWKTTSGSATLTITQCR